MLRAVFSRVGLALRFYVGKALRLNAETLRLRRLPLADRLRLVAQTSTAVLALTSRRPAVVKIGSVRFRARSALDLGSFQSCVVDVHDEIVVPGILDGMESPVVVDVGANVGQFTSAVKVFFPAAHVIAFEPDPEVHRALAANTADLDGVETRCVAVGDEPGAMPLFRHDVSLMSTLRPAAVETYDPADTVEVEIVRLDDALAGVGRIDLLKVDVEGFELEALRGASATLARSRYLLVEVGLARDEGARNLAVLDAVGRVVPKARIVRFGRPLGPPSAPICQDVLISLA